MKWILAALALTAVNATAAEPKSYALQGIYGSLAYQGEVTREDAHGSVLFRVENLRITLDPQAATNATTQLNSPSIRLVTSVLGRNGEKATVTYEALVPTSITLSAQSPSAVVENLQFSVPAVTLQSAEYAGLSVTDGRLLWPMHHNLKP
jgi:hypothetical protein